MTQVSMSQDELNAALTNMNIQGYLRGIRHMSSQLAEIVRSLEASCQEIERQYNLRKQKGDDS